MTTHLKLNQCLNFGSLMNLTSPQTPAISSCPDGDIYIPIFTDNVIETMKRLLVFRQQIKPCEQLKPKRNQHSCDKHPAHAILFSYRMLQLTINYSAYPFTTHDKLL